MSNAEAEIHIVGEITGGSSFDGHSFLITYEVVAGSQWTLIEGADRGTSHVMQNSPNKEIAWSFPIDLHYRLCSVQGWPKISVQVWAVDEYGRKDVAGYGVAYLPMPGGGNNAALDGASSNQHNGGTGAAPGFGTAQVVHIDTWKPTYSHGSGFANLMQQIRQAVMGGNPVLRDDSVVYNNDMRYKLHTMSSGRVTMHFTVMMRNARLVGLK